MSVPCVDVLSEGVFNLCAFVPIAAKHSITHEKTMISRVLGTCKFMAVSFMRPIKPLIRSVNIKRKDVGSVSVAYPGFRLLALPMSIDKQQRKPTP